jgi:hypothetical protein
MSNVTFWVETNQMNTRIQSITTQKTTINIFTAVKTSNLNLFHVPNM